MSVSGVMEDTTLSPREIISASDEWLFENPAVGFVDVIALIKQRSKLFT
jgi:hypothetical protein